MKKQNHPGSNISNFAFLPNSRILLPRLSICCCMGELHCRADEDKKSKYGALYSLSPTVCKQLERTDQSVYA